MFGYTAGALTRSLTRSLTRQRRGSCLPLGCCSGSDWLRVCQKPFIQRRLLLIPPLFAELAGCDPGTSRRQVTLPNFPDGRRPNYALLDAPQLMNSDCSELLLPVLVGTEHLVGDVQHGREANIPAHAGFKQIRRTLARGGRVGSLTFHSPTNRSRFSCSVRIEVTTAGRHERDYLLVGN